MVPSLLPFGMTEEMRAFANYWHAILPGSKRYVSGYRVFGANTDVRLPTPAEWKGGVVWSECGSDNRPVDQMRRVTLALDGVFFSNGELAGLNGAQLYEPIVCDAEAYREVAAGARFESGAAAHHILEAVEKITGPVHHRPPPLAPPPSG